MAVTPATHSAIRPSVPEDAPEIVRLLAEAGLRPNSRPEDLRWKYWQPRADWSGPRSFVLTRGDELIAHGAIVPGWCEFEGQRMSLIHVIDWAARGGAAGAGTMLMKHMGRQAQALLSIGGSIGTQQVLPYLGFRPAGTAVGYVLTLGPRRLLRAVRQRNWRLLPRLLRSWLWSQQMRAADMSGWHARRLSRDSAAAVAAVLPQPQLAGADILGRSVEQLQYMLDCPILSMRLYAAEHAGVLRGYFLLAFAPGQVRIADCWLQSQEQADWQAVLRCAVEEARKDPDVAEVVAVASDSAFSAALTGSGFRARFRVPVQVRLPAGMAASPRPLGVRMLDNDAAYCFEPAGALWA